MGQAKQKGTFEQRKKQAKEKWLQDSDQCTLLGVATYNGKPFFMGCGEVLIPYDKGLDFGQSKWEKKKDMALGLLCDKKRYNTDKNSLFSVKSHLLLQAIGMYLEYSPTLWSEREHPGLIISGTCARTGHEHKVNLQDLGCVFEYELKDNIEATLYGVSINTLGPKWMATADVLKEPKARGLKVPQKRKVA